MSPRVRDGDESDGEEGSGRGGFQEGAAGLAGGRVFTRIPGEVPKKVRRRREVQGSAQRPA